MEEIAAGFFAYCRRVISEAAWTITWTVESMAKCISLGGGTYGNNQNRAFEEVLW